MGYCASTDHNEPSKLEKQQPFQGGSESLKPTKSPPPSLYQEETVKEVLSETPKPKPPKNPIEIPHQESGLQHQEVHKDSIRLDPAFLDEVKMKESKFTNISKEVHHQGQVFEQDESEVCSLSYSESISTTTTNNNDKRDYYHDDDEVKQRVSRSPLPPRNRVSGELGLKKDRFVGKSPARRTTEQSPSKRNGAINGGSVRLVQSREMGSGQVGARDPARKRETREKGQREGPGHLPLIDLQWVEAHLQGQISPQVGSGRMRMRVVVMITWIIMAWRLSGQVLAMLLMRLQMMSR